MTVDDRTRLDLLRKLEAVLAPEEADTLMAHLPPTTWQDIATKDDLRVLGADLRAEIADLRTDLHTELADVRTELADVRTEISHAIDRQTQWMVMFICVWSAIVVAAARLLFRVASVEHRRALPGEQLECGRALLPPVGRAVDVLAGHEVLLDHERCVLDRPLAPGDVLAVPGLESARLGVAIPVGVVEVGRLPRVGELVGRHELGATADRDPPG